MGNFKKTCLGMIVCVLICLLLAYSSPIYPTKADIVPLVDTCTVTFATSSGGTTDLSGNYTYNAGSQVSINATPNSGYSFSSWIATPSSSVTFANASSASTNATIKGAGTITATFTQAPTPSPTPTPASTSVPNPTSTPTSTSAPSTVPSPTPHPSSTPIPSSITISATTISGSNINFTASGDITGSKIISATISTDQSNSSTSISLALVTENAMNGFNNLTIPKEALPYGTTPTVYVNNQAALVQGYTQDAKNYYVWYTTYYSAYELQIIFWAKPTTTQFPTWIILVMATIGILSTLSVLLPRKLKRKKTLE